MPNFNLRRCVATLCLGVATLAAPVTASANLSGIVLFGDSLSDSGNTQAVLGSFPLVANLAGYGSDGRFTNGPVWHEYLAYFAGVAPAGASRSGGTNFAHGGARIDFETGFSAGVIAQYGSYLERAGGAGADPNGLYTLWAGGNDMRDLVGSSDPLPAIDAAVNVLGAIVGDLINAGATTFLVPNLPDLGRIPENLDTANAASASFVSQLWNSRLLSTMSNLSVQTGADIYYLDVFSVFNVLLEQPAALGFTNTTTPCRSLADSGFTEVSCAGAEGYVFWDQIHPTTTAHLVLGLVAYDLLANGTPLPVPEPATVLQLALGLVLLMGLARRRAKQTRGT